MKYPACDMIDAHFHSYNNRTELMQDNVCGCFFCLRIFSPSEIKEWIKDESGTAICPYCGNDTVLGESSGFQIKKGFLRAMKKFWILSDEIK